VVVSNKGYAVKEYRATDELRKGLLNYPPHFWLITNALSQEISRRFGAWSFVDKGANGSNSPLGRSIYKSRERLASALNRQLGFFTITLAL
jgi:hypothetical protein